MNDADGTADENGEEHQGTTINFKPSFVLIAIDTHPSMFVTRKDEDGEESHPFKDALTACYEIADSLIFSTSRSNYNQFGVVLADEDQKASLVEVENNLLDSVKLLRKECHLSNGALKTKYERSNDLDLASFFLFCKKKFKDINSAYYKRTIIFITTDDDPLKGNDQRKFSALNEAKTFEPSDITLEVVPMNENFDEKKFYNELFYLCSKSTETLNVYPDKDSLVDKLSSSIVFRYTKLRYNFFPFKDDHSRYLKVMKVNFIREAKLYNTQKASRDGRLLVRVQQDSGPGNQEPITFRIAKSTGDAIELDLKDKYDIYANDLPLGFHLQYVSDRQTDVGVVIDNVSILLLDPNEESHKYFNQFWQYCAAKDKVLVCLKKYKHPCEIRYVELIPKYANKQRLFLIKDIPFCEEYKLPKDIELAEPLDINPTDQQKRVVRNLIETLKFDYDPKMFINPSYNKKKAYVKAKLLGEPEEEVEDPTADTSGIDEQIGELVKEVEGVFNISALPSAKKRKAPASEGSGRGRKAAK